MQNYDNDTFDAQIKALLSDAQEEVPAGVWEAVSAAAANATPVEYGTSPSWVRPLFAFAVAAASAVVLSIIPRASEPGREFDLLTPTPVVVLDSGISNLVAQSSDKATIKIPEIKAVSPTIVDKTPSERTTIPTVGEENEPVFSPAQVEKEEEAEKESPVLTDPFEQILREDKAAQDKKSSAAKGRLTLGAGGNISSNGNNAFPGNVYHATAGVLGTPTETTIREKSISTYSVPASFGVSVSWAVNEKIAISTGVNYSLLGRNFSGEYIEVEGGVAKPAISTNVYHQMQYVGVPVKVLGSLVSKPGFDLYGFAGAQIEKCLSNKYFLDDQDNTVFRKNVPGLQASVMAGLGVQFNISNHLGLYVDPSVSYYFNCNQPRSIRTAKPLMMGFEAGIRFNI